MNVTLQEERGLSPSPSRERSKSMKCPLANSMRTDTPGEIQFAFRDCLEGECAWWDKSFNCCAMLSKAEWLDTISMELNAIEKKLPSHGRLI